MISMDYSKDETITMILKCLQAMGLYVGYDEIDTILLEDLIEDSLGFITFISLLEEESGINVPDEYLTYDFFGTVLDTAKIVKHLQN